MTPDTQAPPGTKVLEVRGLVKEYPGVKALQGVDLEVLSGEVHCLLGPNGAGKTTLIKCVSGVIEPTAGEILLGGEPLPVGNPAAVLDNGVATIYQELDLVAELTVAQSGSATTRSPRAPGFESFAPPPSRSSRSPALSPTTSAS
jgi:ribose transport system ATP-binding protein